MAIRNIITKENPLLRKKSRAVTDFDDRLATLIDDMIDTMYKAEGVGLAAVQVG
ncbi:MAG: peptide deformylase, partial [Clostridia bacterium]|nr:peptide deformylase [Clostridia bacterium]